MTFPAIKCSWFPFVLERWNSCKYYCLRITLCSLLQHRWGVSQQSCCCWGWGGMLSIAPKQLSAEPFCFFFLIFCRINVWDMIINSHRFLKTETSGTSDYNMSFSVTSGCLPAFASLFWSLPLHNYDIWLFHLTQLHWSFVCAFETFSGVYGLRKE